jgi:hypothetical protein
MPEYDVSLTFWLYFFHRHKPDIIYKQSAKLKNHILDMYLLSKLATLQTGRKEGRRQSRFVLLGKLQARAAILLLATPHNVTMYKRQIIPLSLSILPDRPTTALCSSCYKLTSFCP